MNKLILTTFLIIIAIGLTLSFTRSEYSEYRQVKEEAGSYEAALEQAAELSELRQSLLTDLNDIELTDRQRLEKFLPRNIDTVRLTIEISSIAKNSGMSVDQFSFTEGQQSLDTDEQLNQDLDTGIDEVGVATNAIQTNSNYSLVDMTLAISGTYADFKSFVNTIEENLRLTDIQSFTVNQNDDGTNEFTVVLRTYWLGT